MKNFANILLALLLFGPMHISAQYPSIVDSVKTEARPAARWWWLGSAVDEKNITANLEEYARKGMGSLEITPIYGVKNNDENNVTFLSDRWMYLLDYTISEGRRLGIDIDMNAGTGWPFGGPSVKIEDGACKVVFRTYTLKQGQSISEKIVPEDKKIKYALLEKLMAYGPDNKIIDLTSDVIDGNVNWTAPRGEWKLYAVFCGKTNQKVKRAAPGGEGLVMDHFSKTAVNNYFRNFDEAFARAKSAFPHNFFNDSYEVYKADWTAGFFDEFARRRRYRLEYHLPEFIACGDDDASRRLISDYRETLGEMLLENFTRQFTSWADSHGARTRNQAHGSPANLIDIYASVDVPECESFGISDFGIKGLRVDSLKKKNDSELTMLKYASSAAHISGKPLVSSETFTWLTEHFRTSLSQCKPDIDLMFLSGVNHTFFHGTPYSPVDAPWPGWMFYASINMTPYNNIWEHADSFFDYITRCQSFLQSGEPDNDFLVYLPVYDMWYEQDGRLLLFDIHKMQRRAPEFIASVNRILEAGYDVDYISDSFIRNCCVKDGEIQTNAGVRYKALILPSVKKMPDDVLQHISELVKQGAKVAFAGGIPDDVPGLYDVEKRRKKIRKIFSGQRSMKPDSVISLSMGKGSVILGNDYEKILPFCSGKKELMKIENNLSCIRRRNSQGYHYFVASLQPEDVDGWVKLGVPAKAVELFDPLTGEKTYLPVRCTDDVTECRMQIRSGQSLLLTAYREMPESDILTKKIYKQASPCSYLQGPWTLEFIKSQPSVCGVFELKELGSWTELPDTLTKVNMATGLYKTTFFVSEDRPDEWLLSLGDVRESARIRINGRNVTTLWSVPYDCYIGDFVKTGENLLEIEVVNLPANRIADYDRRKISWRNFKEINVVNINYKKDDYSSWQCVQSGLLGPVRLIPCKEIVE